MATVIEPRHADDIEQVLVQLDRDFAAVYGPDPGAWSKGVRGEYLETLRAHRTVDRETHPLHPRKASASRRRRHRTQLAWRIHRIVPDAVTVLLTPAWLDVHGPMERVFVVTARDSEGRRLRLPRGGSRQIAALMQGAYPAADWNHAHTWRADSEGLLGWQARGRAR